MQQGGRNPESFPHPMRQQTLTQTQGRSTPYQHPPLDHILNELRRGLDEQRKVKEDVRRIGLVVGKVEESIRELSALLKQHTEQSFTIESSTFKVSENRV